MSHEPFDVIIVGAGPAGLSAALILGRSCRRVLVCDTGKPRNASSHAMHGFLSRDGMPPRDFLRISREEVRRYRTIEFLDVEVTDATCIPEGRFAVTLADGTRRESKKLLIATGVIDKVPDIEGFARLYGRSVFHCPYCDGWELRDQPIAIYGRGERAVGLSLELTGWSRDLVVCSDGPSEIDADSLARLERNRIRVREDRIERLEGEEHLERIIFASGDPLIRRAIFFTTGQEQRSHLATSLGCQFNDKGTVLTGQHETTHLPGLYVAGDASRAVQWVVVAAAEGAEAAFAINTDLLKESLL